MVQHLCRASIVLIAGLFIVAGANHFVSPNFYLKIMPPYVPWPLALIYVSGFFEIVGGVGVAVSRLRWAAGWGLVALLVAVFPANVHMALHAEDYANVPHWALIARLPLQFLLIAWVWWATIAVSSNATPTS